MGLSMEQPGLVAWKIILTAPAVEAETLSSSLAATADHDRPGVAQPDIAKGLDNDFGKGG